MDDSSRKPKNAGLWARDPLDWYVEPEWASERLFETVTFSGRIIDPACGLGRIVASARSAGLYAQGFDIKIRSPLCDMAEDFFDLDWPVLSPENIVCNPPFGRADEFARLGLLRVRYTLALLLPATWHFGEQRARWLETTPLWRVLALTPRPSMPPGAVILAGEKPGGGTKDFAWYIWMRGHQGPWQGGWLHRDKPSR